MRSQEGQARTPRKTQELINKQGQRLKESKTSVPENRKKEAPKAIIQTFQALNENENVNKDDWRSPPTKKDTKQWNHDEEPATQETVPLVESETKTETQGGATHAEETDAGSESGESIEVSLLAPYKVHKPPKNLYPMTWACTKKSYCYFLFIFSWYVKPKLISEKFETILLSNFYLEI